MASVVSLLHAGEAVAQTGSIVGTIRDEQDAVLVGASVTVRSPSLIGGSIADITNERGEFGFRSLSGGTYALEVTSTGFTKQQVNDIVVQIGKTTEMRVVLKIENLANSITVQGPDRRDTGFSTNLSLLKLSDIPFHRNNASDAIKTVPMMSTTSQGSQLLSAAGSGVDTNLYRRDGMNVTAPTNGVHRSETGLDFTEEIHVQMLGASAEYGNFQGAVIEFVTPQGGNRFHWHGAFYGQPAWLASQPITLPINGSGNVTSGYERRRFYDATTSLGGPIVRDWAWFFAGYQYMRDEDSQPGGDPDWPKQYGQDKVFGKLTWRLPAEWQLAQNIQLEYWRNRELPTVNKEVEATQRLEASVPAITFGHLTRATSRNSLWDITFGRFSFRQDITRSTGPDVSGRLDRLNNVAMDAPMQVGQLEQSRWTASAVFSHAFASFLGIAHDLRTGVQAERGYHRSLLVVPTGRRYEDDVSRIPVTQAFESGPSNAGGLALTGSAFITDSLLIGERVTVSAGVRFDHSRGISPDVRRLDANGNDTGETIQGIDGGGTVYTWNVFSPRTGVAVSLGADNRTVVKGHYGRFVQGPLTGELSIAHPGVAPVYRYDVGPDGVSLSNRTLTNPNLRIDKDTRPPTTDAFSMGIEHRFARGLSVGANYAHKIGRDLIGWEDSGGVYRKDRLEIDVSTDPAVSDLRALDVYLLTTPAASRIYTLTNPSHYRLAPDGQLVDFKDYSLTYDGVSVWFEKHQTGWGHVSGSYTWSRAKGLQPSSGTTAAGAQVATVGAPPVSFAPPVTYGRDPNTLTNGDGLLPNDRPHMFQMMGVTEIPKVRVSVAANLQYATGKPYALTTDIAPGSLPGAPATARAQNTVRVLLEPRGSQRLSSQAVVDLRVAKMLSCGAACRFELRFDVLNLFNDSAEESIVSDLYTQQPAQGNVFLNPRRVMVNVEMRIGK